MKIQIQNIIRFLGLLFLAATMILVNIECGGGGGGSGSGNQYSVTLSPPPNLTATPANGQVTLSWDGVTGAISYNIYDSISSGGPYSKVSLTNTTNYTVVGLYNDTTYYFVVTAVNKSGESTYSAEVSATPSIYAVKPSSPTSLKIIVLGDGSAQLVWNASAGATSYNVYSSVTSGGPYSASGITNTSGYTVSGLTNDSAYYFVVTAVNSKGESGYSNEVEAIPVAPPPNLTAIAGDGQVALSWSTSTGATSYNVYTATTSGGPYTKAANTVSTSFTVTGLSSINGMAYYFVVTAANSTGESNYSNEVSSVAYLTHIYSTGGTGTEGIAIDSSGNVWVTNNSSNNVTKISPSGTIIGTYAVGNSPLGIAIDASGNVWVANYSDNTVTELSSSGSVVGTYSVSGANPGAIAIDAFGNVWVANYGGAYPITELNSSGTDIGDYFLTYGDYEPVSIGIWGGSLLYIVNTDTGYDSVVTEMNSTGSILNRYTFYKMASPTSIAIAPDNSGFKIPWVAGYDWMNGTNCLVNLWDYSVNYATYDVAPLAWNWSSLAADSSGNIWMTNASGSAPIVEFSTNGSGYSASEIRTYFIGGEPQGIAIDASGNVWVADYSNNTVIKLDGVAKGPQYWTYAGPQYPGGANF